jgi:glutamine phosphoribosylpyrophosphate amidotransferase
MCSVIGIVIKQPTVKDFQLVRNIFKGSKIRGMHATGMSFLPHWSKEIVTIKDAIPADKFVDVHLQDSSLIDMISDDGVLYLIGHCRYSTSDLEYNQPLYTSEKSIVHNGVITQESPDKWKHTFGYDCITKNDSELVLHSEDPLNQFHDMSMSVCELNIEKILRVYRNGKRPLYFTSVSNGVIITSTADIARRAGLENVKEVDMNVYMNIDSSMNIKEVSVNVFGVDYQKVDYELS